MYQHCTAPYGNTAAEWYIVRDWKEVVVVDGSTATGFCAVLCDEIDSQLFLQPRRTPHREHNYGSLGIFLDLLQRKYVQREII